MVRGVPVVRGAVLPAPADRAVATLLATAAVVRGVVEAVEATAAEAAVSAVVATHTRVVTLTMAVMPAAA